MSTATQEAPPGPDQIQATDGGLLSKSFLGLLLTQLLGAANDNMFRLLAVGIATDYLGKESSSTVISVGLASFTLPYLLFAAPAGYLADRFSKRTVIVLCKVLEIAIMAMAVAAIWLGNVYVLFLVLALMGGQSALFGPAKLGSIPEMLRADRISIANGIMSLATLVATVTGVVAGNYLAAYTRPKGLEHLWVTAALLIGTAIAGTLTSLMIAKGSPGDAKLKLPWNPLVQTWRDLKSLAASRAMLRVALGSAFFWFLGALAQSNILEYGKEGGLLQESTSPLLAALVLGVGLGSVLAGIWSNGKVELGILPLGAAGIVVSSVLLYVVDEDLTAPGRGFSAAYLFACLWLFALGVGSGLFDVPLMAYLQHRSDPRSRGAILAASNFITFTAMLLSAGLYFVLRAPLGEGGTPLLDAHQIFLLGGAFTVPVFLYIVFLLPGASMRFVVWLASHTAYRVRVYGRDNLPERGGAILVSNHVTWIDGALLLIASSRPIRLVVHVKYMQGWVGWLARVMNVIPIEPGAPSVKQSLEAAKEAVAAGELVCFFPEGGRTATGQLQPFKPGFLNIAAETGVPVIPVFIDELWGSIFSKQGGSFRWKRPGRWPAPVSIHFGRPAPRPDDLDRVRGAVEELAVSSALERQRRQMNLPRMFLRMCKRRFFHPKVADSTGAELTGGKLLIGTLALRRAMLRELIGQDEKYVGVLLPPSVGAAVVNMALPLANRIAVNLNYTVSSEIMNSCIAQCGVTHVLTSRKVMEKLNLQLDAELIYLDEFKSRVTKLDKAVAALQAALLPSAVLESLLGVKNISPQETLTVIFTSGSTGEPKGVTLSHGNVGANIQAIDEAVHLRADDVAIGVLPFFHSYGYTATLWTVMALDPKGVYHFNPLDAGQVGKLCAKHRGTILMVTPTFLRSYLRRCDPEEFKSLDIIFASAERLPKELADAFEKKFGMRPLEAYGATECSPLISVNVPESRLVPGSPAGAKEGSVGRPISGVTAKIVHPDTGETLGVDQPGMLLIKGPNVMQGYLHRPELTAKVLKDGWYVTGDFAKLDADGFIFITGRQSRFSKIGGEMVPHIKIEELLQKILAAGEEELLAVVSAVPDEKKGERIVVLHKAIVKSPQQVCKELQEAGLPNLWIPSPDSFSLVEEIPVLGTGKLDLKALKDLAMNRFGQNGAA